MGEMEDDSKRRWRRTRLQEGILSSIEIAGVLVLSVAAPNVVRLLRKRYSDRSVNNAVARLAQKGLVEFGDVKGKKYLRLTPTGRRHMDQSKVYHVTRPKRWDGKWRIVTFDIAQSRDTQRTLLRQTLKQIGFVRLQDSVWVFPYDCEDLITLLKADYGLGKEVLYIIADSIERDSEIRTHFKLKT